MTARIVMWLAVGLCVRMAFAGAWGEVPSGDAKELASMSQTEKLAYLQQATFETPAERQQVVEYFGTRWDDEEGPVLIEFCKAMGRARVVESVPVLVAHMDYRYFGEATAAGPSRTILQERFALEALASIGEPALAPATDHIVRRLGTATDRFELYFYRAALKYLATRILGEKQGAEYVTAVVARQERILEQLHRMQEE